MRSNYHTHAWVQFTSLKKADQVPPRIELLSINDSDSLGAAQQVTLSLAGRSEDGQLWHELISVGDLLDVGFHYHDNESTHARYTLTDARVRHVSVREVLQDGHYQFTVNITASSLQDLLNEDAVAYWMFYGSALGATRGRAILSPEDLSGNLAKVVANYLSRTAFTLAHWSRDDVSLGDRMGYHTRALRANVPPLINLQVAEGTHWSIMSSHAELNFHEFFVQNRSRKASFYGGFVHHPTYKGRPLIKSDDSLPHDGSHPYIILRPKPYPYGDKNGQVQMDEWNALELHDFSDDRYVIAQTSFSYNLSGVRNFFMVYPSLNSLNDQMAFATGIGVVHEQSVREFGYRPVKFKTQLIQNLGSEQNLIDVAKELTWRVAVQLNRQDEMLSGSTKLPLSPQVTKGTRLRFRILNTDGKDSGLYQGYITAVMHNWELGKGGSTSVELERVLPERTYKNPAWFAEGLQNVDLEAQITARHSE